jgi:hypothetical protein
MMENKESSKWEGLTIDGKPLNSYFQKDKDTEIASEVATDFGEQQKKKRRIFIRPKYEDKKERSGKMNLVNQVQINRENWKRYIEQATSLKDQIISYFLSGESFTAVSILERNILKDKQPKSAIWNCLSNLMRTELGAYINRKKVSVQGNKMFEYWFDQDGLELTPTEAYQFSKKIIKKGKEPKKKKKKSVSVMGEEMIELKKYEEAIIKLKDQTNRLEKLQQKIESIQPNTQNISIVVSGKIEHIFRLKLG